MASRVGLHEMLPWYVAGTLDAKQADEFRQHLAECQSCRNEVGVLEPMRDELERHGAALLEDHPAAELVVAAARGELDGPEAERLRRHLALCSACATEVRWVRGDGVPHPSGSAVEKTNPFQLARWGWLAAAAAMRIL